VQQIALQSAPPATFDDFFCRTSAIRALQNPYSRYDESTPSISCWKEFLLQAGRRTNQGSRWRRGPIKVTALWRERRSCSTRKKPTWLLATRLRMELNRHVVANSGYWLWKERLGLTLSNKGHILRASCLPLALKVQLALTVKLPHLEFPMTAHDKSSVIQIPNSFPQKLQHSASEQPPPTIRFPS
jgi:hypothetical protein